MMSIRLVQLSGHAEKARDWTELFLDLILLHPMREEVRTLEPRHDRNVLGFG
jgi:hypothetical protein